MGVRRLLVLLVLGLWLFLGPVSMAFDGCLLMGALCEGGPCGASSDVRYAPAPAMAPAPVAYVDGSHRARLPDDSPASLEPPPKSFRPAA